MEAPRRKHKRRKSDSQKKKQEEDLFHCLPREIRLDILSRVPMKSVIQWRVVCRSWNLLSRDPYLFDMHLNRARDDARIWLFFVNCYRQILFVELSDADDITKKKIVRHQIDIPFSRGFKYKDSVAIIGSCNGFLCLTDYRCRCPPIYIFNPFTGYYKLLSEEHLTNHKYDLLHVSFGFGRHPITHDYTLVRVTYSKSKETNIVHVHSLSTDKWERVGDAPAPCRLEPGSSGVFVSGRLHWINLKWSNHPKIFSFDLVDNSFQEVPIEFIQDSNTWMPINYLRSLRGYLSVVLFDNVNMAIWVMLEYGVQESWVKLYTFEERLVKGLKPSPCVLCSVRNGAHDQDILLRTNNTGYVLYNPRSHRWRHLTFKPLPVSRREGEALEATVSPIIVYD